jgi:hypothetical protein
VKWTVSRIEYIYVARGVQYWVQLDGAAKEVVKGTGVQRAHCVAITVLCMLREKW